GRKRIGDGDGVSGKRGEVAVIPWRDGVGLARVALLESPGMRLRDRDIRHRDVSNRGTGKGPSGVRIRIVGLERGEVATWSWRDRALGGDCSCCWRGADRRRVFDGYGLAGRQSEA